MQSHAQNHTHRLVKIVSGLLVNVSDCVHNGNRLTHDLSRSGATLFEMHSTSRCTRQSSSALHVQTVWLCVVHAVVHARVSRHLQAGASAGMQSVLHRASSA